MAEMETEWTLDEMERGSLEKLIAQAQSVIAEAGAGARPIMEHFVQNAKMRLGTLERKIKDSQEEREASSQAAARSASLAALETRLTAEEQETYAGFLRKDFFTKSDFSPLEQFYGKSWERLSERGKDEMSRRIWEGIRHKEYTFAELPKNVREKETEWAYSVIVKRKSEVAAVPEMDREDFCRAYEAGQREEAEKVLERDSFKKSLFLGSDSKRMDHGTVERGQEKEADAIADRIRERAPQSEAPARQTSQEEATTLRRRGVSLKPAVGDVSSSSIPVNDTSAQNKSRSLPS